MTDQHRATPEQWKTVEIYAEDGSDEDNVTDSCILELRSRVEALEAAQLEQAESHRFCVDAIVRRVEALEAAQQIRVFSAEEVAPIVVPASVARPAGGLVERVANAIYNVPHDSAAEARAAIREVAAWLRENDSECQMGGDAAATAELLEQEADRG